MIGMRWRAPLVALGLDVDHAERERGAGLRAVLGRLDDRPDVQRHLVGREPALEPHPGSHGQARCAGGDRLPLARDRPELDGLSPIGFDIDDGCRGQAGPQPRRASVRCRACSWAESGSAPVIGRTNPAIEPGRPPERGVRGGCTPLRGRRPCERHAGEGGTVRRPARIVAWLSFDQVGAEAESDEIARSLLVASSAATL